MLAIKTDTSPNHEKAVASLQIGKLQENMIGQAFLWCLLHEKQYTAHVRERLHHFVDKCSKPR